MFYSPRICCLLRWVACFRLVELFAPEKNPVSQQLAINNRKSEGKWHRMVRISLMSDIHNEFEPPRQPTAGWFALNNARKATKGHPEKGPLLTDLRGQAIDLVVLAGDIDIGSKSIVYADQVSRFLNVRAVSLAGNHEGYGRRDLNLLIPELRAAAASTEGRVTFLENESVTFDFDGQRLHVLGCTLWTDYAVNGAEPGDIERAMRNAEDGLNDHRLIVQDGRVFTPQDALARHLESRAWLAMEIARIQSEDGPEARILVVTHHAPVPEANGEFMGGKLSAAYASDLRQEIAHWRPDAWFFGHTHYSFDMMVGPVRVVSAQRGYVCREPGAEDFVPRMVEI